MSLYESTLKNWWDEDSELNAEEQRYWHLFAIFLAAATVLVVIAFFIHTLFVVPAMACCVVAAHFNEKANKESHRRVELAAATRADIAYIEPEENDK